MPTDVLPPTSEPHGALYAASKNRVKLEMPQNKRTPEQMKEKDHGETKVFFLQRQNINSATTRV